MADFVTRDQQTGRIPTSLDPFDTALALVALAEGLSAYVVTGVTARNQVPAVAAGVYR
ncbi:hypothetical protein [Nonomuraea sp. NPDC005692]|uniref:hypothetical protein n=1 Tax=Nonomuraea sp. NPDC005692 TaxID=3157168 RepID=UPI003407C7A6